MSIILQLLTKLSFKGLRSEIAIYPASFELEHHNRLDDFLSSLEDHEYFHAREAYEIPRKLNIIGLKQLKQLYCYESDELIKESIDKNIARIELRTTNNQIRNLPSRNCSKEYKLFLDHKITELESCLKTQAH